MNDRPLTPAEQDSLKDAFVHAMVDHAWSASPSFAHGSDAHHVLRLIAAGEISADKGAELLTAMQRGETPVLPSLTI